MRKTFLFAILTLLALPTLAEYVYRDSKHEFLTPTTAWIEGFGHETEGRYQVSAISLGYYTVDGDTLIDGKSYYRIRLNKVCHPFVYLEWDEQGREIIRDKEVETYDSDLCFFMREDESGDVWLSYSTPGSHIPRATRNHLVPSRLTVPKLFMMDITYLTGA